MAHAIQATEFFRMLVAKRHKRRIDESVQKRRAFMSFCESDPHRNRRNVYERDKKRIQSETARMHQIPLLHLLNEPSELVQEIVMSWLPLAEIPEDVITHVKACQNYHMLRVPQPVTGIEVFRQKVPSHDVILKVVDPNSNNKAKDLLLADFRKVPWQEWHAVNTKHETYYTPMVFSGYDENGKTIMPVQWDRVDLYTRPVSKKGHKLKPKRLGSVEDIQSYVIQKDEDDESPSKRQADRAISVLRFNLGNHLYNSDKIRLQEKDWRSKQSGVLPAGRQLQNLKGLGTNLRDRMSRSRNRDSSSRSRGNVASSAPIDLSEGDCVLV
jgi:hypothetical protein